MKLKITLLLMLGFSFSNIKAQPYYPGGVTGAEAWYIVNYNDINQSVPIFPNRTSNLIKLESCGMNITNGLFNFNHSILTDNLCLKYLAQLENTTSRNIFFVGEPKDPTKNMSHLTTECSYTIVNRFDFSNNDIYNNNLVLQYNATQPKIETINFYNFNNYQLDKKYRSFGLTGETSFSIGKSFTTPLVDIPYETPPINSIVSQNFYGNFPEFISFPFELTINQKERVESYLALKYGITLSKGISYRNSGNLIFWHKNNNTLFGHDIFGVGRDNISGLNQLQSESVHDKDYLAASIEKLLTTNREKQQQINIPDNHFIVYGHNGQDKILQSDKNAHGVRPLKRIWLSQNTGENSKTFPMYFRLNIQGEIAAEFQANPSMKLWMLHDKNTANNEVSDFTGQHVIYYEAASIFNMQYGIFEKVFFDTDAGVYDQYTFGIGPQMIVQAQFNDDCRDNRVRTNIVITGSNPPYAITITDTNGNTQNITGNSNNVTFEAISPNTYTINVNDTYNNSADTTIDVNVPQIAVNFDDTYILSNTQQQITLDAGLNVNDPNATYQWFKDGVQLENFSSVLVVTQPGDYKVIVTSGNLMCSNEDQTRVYYNFTGTVKPRHDCNLKHGFIDLELDGGISPYITVISGNGTPINVVHSSENPTFTNIPFGTYAVTTTDSIGTVFTQNNITVLEPLEGIELDLLSQLLAQCGSVTYNTGYDFPFPACINTITVDASLLVTNPYASYEWFANGVTMETNNPVLQITANPSQSGTGITEYTVVITNEETWCTVSESFGTKSYWETTDPAMQITDTETTQESSKEESDTDDHSEYTLKTKIYPNPSDHNATFYYEISATEPFSGIVQIFTPTGALIKEQKIEGQAGYTIPFYLLTSGTYFVRTTTTTGKIVSDKIVIK